MKKIKVLFLIMFLISAGSSFQLLYGQEKSKEEVEKEQKILKSIEEQKKAMADQKKAQSEAEAALHDQKAAEMENRLNDLNVQVGRAGDGVRVYSQRGNRSFNFDEPFMITPGSDSYFLRGQGDGERTTWDLSKSVKESSFTKNYSFDVDKTAKNVIMSIMGDCKSGEIRIRIVMPNGKNYSDILIDEFGNLNWRKSFNISDTENQDKTGEWKFVITSAKATGYFKIALQTY